MSARSWKLRVEDIFESIQNIRIYSEGMTYSTWCKDKKTIDAVVRNFEILGEAANHIPTDIQSQYPHIPWHQMRGIRNILIHEYFGMDEDVIWETIQNDIPVLEELFSQLLKKI